MLYSVIGTCDFEVGLCTYTNDHSGADNFDWVRHKGRTSSSGTGPTTDHTKGSALGIYNM